MNTQHKEHKPSLLLVDDEPNILRSLQRLLRHDDYDITLAGSGDEALTLLELTAFDMVISDARMPGMDGATLLGHALRLYPESIRILLTGYADISTTVKAVNEGRIFRYISKPWDDEELKQTLRQGQALQKAKRESHRLSCIVAQQNQQLKKLNQQLEGQIESKTSELEQTADMLDLTFEELKQSYIQATEVFGSLISLRMPPAQQLNARVVAICRAMSQVMDFSEKEIRDLTMAASLYNIGKLGWDERMLKMPAKQMLGAELAQLLAYPQLSSQILLTLEPMQGAAKIIRHHQERWDGQGKPDGLLRDKIPLASQLLRLAVDFIELQCGLIFLRPLSAEEALAHMQRQIDLHYSPELLPVLIECARQQVALELNVNTIRYLNTRQLLAGMVLGANLHARNGLLLLNEGKKLTAQVIEKLISFESTEKVEYRVPVLKVSLSLTENNQEKVG